MKKERKISFHRVEALNHVPFICLKIYALILLLVLYAAVRFLGLFLLKIEAIQFFLLLFLANFRGNVFRILGLFNVF